MKRIFLFVVTNFAILLVLSVTMQLLGIDRMLAQGTGLNLQGLLVMAAHLRLRRLVHLAPHLEVDGEDGRPGAHVIEVPSNATERWLVDTVKRQAEQGRHRHARSRDLRGARDQRVRDRLEPQQLRWSP